MIIWFGLAAIASGDTVVGVVVALFGAYLLSFEITAIADRRGRAEGLRTLFGLSFLFVLAGWGGVVSGFFLARGGSVWIAILTLVLSAFVLRYGARVLVHWLRARHG